MTTATLSGNLPRRWAVTIPNNTGTGSTILALLQAAGMQVQPESILSLRIEAYAPGEAGTARGAIVVTNPRPGAAIAAGDFTTHGKYVASGVEHLEPSRGDVNSFVRSASAATVTALVTVLH